MILEKYNQLHNQLPYLPHLILLASFMTGMIFGLMISALIPKSQEGCRIEYISRDEIMTLEKARIGRTKERELFFGKTPEVISIIERLARARTDKGSSVIFLRSPFASDHRISSISEEIHSEVIKTLRDEKTDKDMPAAKKEAGVAEDGEEEAGEEEDERAERDSESLSAGSSTNPVLELLRKFERDGKW